MPVLYLIIGAAIGALAIMLIDIYLEEKKNGNI